VEYKKKQQQHQLGFVLGIVAFILAAAAAAAAIASVGEF